MFRLKIFSTKLLHVSLLWLINFHAGNHVTCNNDDPAASPPDDVANNEGSSPFDATAKGHACLMVIGWGFLIPIGIIAARYFKHKGTRWFHIHRAVQSTAFIIVSIGLALGFIKNGGWETDVPVHRNLGITVTILGLVQVISLVARPHPGDKYRYIWFLWHSWIGRSAATLAIANIYYGIVVVGELGTWAWAAYTAVLGVVVLIAVFLEIQLWNRQKMVSAMDAKDTKKENSCIVENGCPPYANPQYHE